MWGCIEEVGERGRQGGALIELRMIPTLPLGPAVTCPYPPPTGCRLPEVGVLSADEAGGAAGRAKAGSRARTLPVARHPKQPQI